VATVLITPEAGEQIGCLPYEIQQRIGMIVRRLEKWPDVSGAKPLRGALAGQFRVRTGDYRVQLVVSGRGARAIVTIMRAGHRDGFYE